jgi:hypothetical protein
MGVSTSMKPFASSWRRREETMRVPLLRHGEQRLGKELQPLRMNAQLARARAEQVAFYPNDVADIHQFEELEIALAHGVFLYVDLQPLAVLLQVREAGLAHVAQGHQAPGNADAHLRRQLFGGLRAIARQDVRNGVGELEPLSVRAVAQGLDLANARQALFE